GDVEAGDGLGRAAVDERRGAVVVLPFGDAHRLDAGLRVAGVAPAGGPVLPRGQLVGEAVGEHAVADLLDGDPEVGGEDDGVGDVPAIEPDELRLGPVTDR